MNAKTALFLVVVGVALFFEAEANAALPAVCSQPLVTGPCRARVTSYGYNVKSGQCEVFFYGGCRGNGNRFGTLEECEATCPSRRHNC